MLPFFDGSVENPEVSNNATIGIVNRIKNQSLQWSLGISNRRWYLVDDIIQNFIHTVSCFTTGFDDIVAVASQQVHNLVFNLFGHGVG